MPPETTNVERIGQLLDEGLSRRAIAERLGNVNYLYASTGTQQMCIESKDGSIAAGDVVRVSIDPKSAHIFSSSGDRI